MPENWEIVTRRWRQKVHDSTADVIRESAQEIAFRVIARTPVLSGQLVQNWRYTDNPLDAEIDTGFGPVRGQAQQKAVARLRQINLLQAFYYLNPVPYAFYIEFGARKDGSRQTIPRAMVRLSVAEWQSITQAAMKKVAEKYK